MSLAGRPIAREAKATRALMRRLPSGRVPGPVLATIQQAVEALRTGCECGTPTTTELLVGVRGTAVVVICQACMRKRVVINFRSEKDAHAGQAIFRQEAAR